MTAVVMDIIKNLASRLRLRLFRFRALSSCSAWSKWREAFMIFHGFRLPKLQLQEPLQVLSQLALSDIENIYGFIVFR